ncbi:MAG TPA: S8 family serine peptidase [Pyrinomonadaceae bacterium]
MSRKLTPLSLGFPFGRLSPLACLSLFVLLAFAGRMVAQVAPSRQESPPVINQDAPNTIPDQYIVVFKPGTTRDVVLAAENVVKRLGGAVGFRYTSSLIGFSVKLPASAAQTLRALRGVAWVEADQKVSIDTIQVNPPKGLDRTSERLFLTNGSLDNKFTYTETGIGVHAYIIDTGIMANHPDFGTRATAVFSSVVGGTADCNGHGTHVAGTIGGTTYGIAKNVSLYGVRVLDCNGSGTVSGVIAGVDWVTNNAIHPAVANMSLGTQPGATSPALDLSVTNSVASGVTYTLAAGNSNADACTVSPARTPTAITVGAIDPLNDTRPAFSNWGTCLDLFAPGVGIMSSWLGGGTMTLQGTSMAAPHVAGVAALYLQNHALASPATVWNHLHTLTNNRYPTLPTAWTGIINPGPGSPNELLHWGSLNDGADDGDPHLTTVDGVHYDFQPAGEFVILRDPDGLEIQTRQTPVATSFNPGANPYTGLATCVSLNTALAARVGQRRVTLQPNLSGVPDPNGLQLRVDGVLTTPTTGGLNLGNGGRVAASTGGSIEIDFPDGTILIATPGTWLGNSFMNVSVFRTPAKEGIMGAIAPGSWLPALPNGTSMGPMPTALSQRYIDLNKTFADAWRVTNATSLFDYAPGTSTATFTFRNWPKENSPCIIPANPPVKPADPRLAQQVCRVITDKNMNANCVFDVTVTGEMGFVKLYLVSQQIRAGMTTTTVYDDRERTQVGEPVTFSASVARPLSNGKDELTGTVQFTINGEKVGTPVRLDSKGNATWKTSTLKVGDYRIAASYIPDRGSVFLASSSADKAHTVNRETEVGTMEAMPVLAQPIKRANK